MKTEKAIKTKTPFKTHQKNLAFEMEKPEAKRQGRSRGRELRNRVLSTCTASASAKAVLSQTEKDIRWVCVEKILKERERERGSTLKAERAT